LEGTAFFRLFLLYRLLPKYFIKVTKNGCPVTAFIELVHASNKFENPYIERSSPLFWRIAISSQVVRKGVFCIRFSQAFQSFPFVFVKNGIK